LDTDGVLEREEEPSVGGTANQEIIERRAVSFDFLQSVEEANCIREGWRLAGYRGAPGLILELGGGYGRLAYVCRQMMPNATYVLLDLPEPLICAHSWVEGVLPAGQLISYPDAGTLGMYSRETSCSRPVWLLGAHAIQHLEEADVFVSISNLNVMSKEAVDDYFAHIDRSARVS